MKKTQPESIERILDKVREVFRNEPEVAETFERCYTNTLDTTVKRMDDGSTYVITGDIPAMWLRDSVAQLRPYLIPAKEDGEIADLIAGLVRRQFSCINIDPYANAFNEAPNGNCWAPPRNFPSGRWHLSTRRRKSRPCCAILKSRWAAQAP